MRIEGIKVVVIGAGIGGLAVARALALRGARVTVLEQAEAIEEVGAGLQISPNGAAVLKALGLEDGLRAGGAVAARAVALHDQSGAPVLRLDLARLSARGYHFVHRADLVDLLAQGARDAGVRIRLLQQVDRVVPGDRPRLVMASGAELSADLVVGADGLHSRLRPVLNGADAPFFTGQVAWRAVIAGDGDAAAPEARVDMGARRHVVSYPLRGGALHNIVAVEERAGWTAEGWHHAGDPGALRAAFADFGPQVRAMLSRVEAVNVWGLFRHPVAATWQRGHCALLGDAAHPTLPFLAQGACMALEDAWVLADALAAGTDIDAGLAAYQRRRAPRVRRVIAAANGNAWKYHLRPGPLRLAAHAALRLGGRLAPAAMVHRYDWLYEHDVTRAALTSGHQVRRLRAEQEMIDADAVIAVPGAGLVIPERVMPRPLHSRAERLGEAAIDDPAEGGAAFWQGERVVVPFVGVGGVLVLGDDVVIAAHQYWFLAGQKIGGPGAQPVHPGQLVVVFRPRRGVAVGQVESADPYRAGVAHDRCLDPSGLFVVLVAGQAARDIL